MNKPVTSTMLASVVVPIVLLVPCTDDLVPCTDDLVPCTDDLVPRVLIAALACSILALILFNGKNKYRRVRTRLAEIVTLTYLLDYTSLYCAIISGIDPSPVSSINFIKSKI